MTSSCNAAFHTMSSSGCVFKQWYKFSWNYKERFHKIRFLLGLRLYRMWYYHLTAIFTQVIYIYMMLCIYINIYTVFLSYTVAQYTWLLRAFAIVILSKQACNVKHNEVSQNNSVSWPQNLSRQHIARSPKVLKLCNLVWNTHIAMQFGSL